MLRRKTSREVGARAESAALAYLRKAGLVEVARNASCRSGELDLVMRDGTALVFVEVRYRRDHRFGTGAASIDRGKRRRLLAAASTFVQRHRQYANAACRFDVIEADGEPAAPRLRWIRNAFNANDG